MSTVSRFVHFTATIVQIHQKNAVFKEKLAFLGLKYRFS